MIKNRILILQISILYLLLCDVLLAATSKPTVFVSIVPQKFFVQQISKDLLNVEVMVKPGASPATYEPKPSQMVKLSSAAAFFAIGVPFEKAWLGRFSGSNPDMKIIQTDRDIEKFAMVQHHHEESEEDGHHHQEYSEQEGLDHGNLDPHIWLSPILVKKQATVILEALEAIDPGHRREYAANYQVFLGKIDALDGEIRFKLKDRKGLRFMVFHPSWGYFAREYGLEQVPIEIEGKSPKPAQLAELIRQARDSDITVVFVQPQFSEKNAKVVAKEIGGKVIYADPLAEDWFANLQDVAEKFKKAVK